MGELKEYVLGSGHLHIQEFTTLPASWDEFFASEDNLLGRIKGGAAVEYSTDKYEDQDDLGYIVIEDIKKEKVQLKSGVMTWDGDTLAKLCSTARTTVGADGVSTVKIGGLANQTNTRWVVGFEHKDKNLRVVIVGRNNDGFAFDFKQDSATVIDCVFRAEAQDSMGTLIHLEDLRKVSTLSDLSIADAVLSPAFCRYTKSYTAATTAATSVVTATAKDSTSTVVIKNGSTVVASGSEATWSTGVNTVTVTVTGADGKVFTYTVAVTKS